MLADESAFPRDLVFTRICHVKQGYEDRRRHIVKEFGRRGVPVYFYTDWDQPEVTPDIRAELIAPDFVHPARVSLALKHVGIWRDFLETDLPYCLVFEDDVFLARRSNADGWLIKPLDAFRLRRAVAALLDGDMYTEGMPEAVDPGTEVAETA